MTDVSLDKNDETSGPTMPSLEENATLKMQEKEKSDTQKRIHGSLKNNATSGDVQVNSFLIEMTGLEEDAPSSLKRRKITNVKRQHSSVGNNGSDHGLQEAIVSTNTCLEREFFEKDGVKTYQRRHKRSSCSVKGSPRPCEEHMGSLMHIVQNSSMGETYVNDSDEVLTGRPLRIKLSGHMGCGIPGPGPEPGQVGEPEEQPEAPANCLSVEPAVKNERDGKEMMHIVWNSSMGETSVNLSDEALTFGSSEIKLSGGMACGISESGRAGKLEGWTEVPANCSVEPVLENRSERTEMMHIVLNSSAGETSLNHSGEALTSGPSGIKLSEGMGCGISGSGRAEFPANCLSVEHAVGNRNMGRGMNLEENFKEHLIHEDEDMGCGVSGSGLVGELEGQAEFPANCLPVECAVEKGNKGKGMNLEGTVKEYLIQKDVSASDLPQLYSEKVSGVKVDQVQNLFEDSTSPSDHVNGFTTSDKNKCSDDLSSSDVVCKHLRQGNGEIETMSGIYCSSSNLDFLEDDNQVFVVQKDDSPQMSHPSPEVYLSGDSRRKLLILDVNGLLADIVSNIFEDYSTGITIGKKSVFKRPFFDDFMQFCFEKFNVGIWTSRTRRNVDMFLDVLMGDFKKQLLFIWDQWHCTDTGRFTIENTKPLFLKELKKLWEKKDPDLPWEKGDYDESNTLLLDDSPYKALGNPPYTAIFPEPYSFKDTEDESLGSGGYLRVYLEGLAKAENVQKYVELNPIGQPAITKESSDWRFYESVLEAAASRAQGDSCRPHGDRSRGGSYRSWDDRYRSHGDSYRPRPLGDRYRSWGDIYWSSGGTHDSWSSGYAYRPQGDDNSRSWGNAQDIWRH